MKTSNQELQSIWDELQDIFKDFHYISKLDVNRLNKLGFEIVYTGKHPKLYFVKDDIKHCITLSSTPSDRYAGRQILRQIRRIYEWK